MNTRILLAAALLAVADIAIAEPAKKPAATPKFCVNAGMGVHCYPAAPPTLPLTPTGDDCPYPNIFLPTGECLSVAIQPGTPVCTIAVQWSPFAPQTPVTIDYGPGPDYCQETALIALSTELTHRIAASRP
jgi:hypothetical protein